MNVQVVLPSRGLIYAKTMVGLLRNIDDENINIIYEKPMPDCFNIGVRQVLDNGADYIWFVEEDNGLPDGVLNALLDEARQGHKIVTMDYTVGGGNSHIYKIDGEPAWCGLGCTLIKRDVFEAIEEPWFEVNKHLNFKDDGFEILEVPEENVAKKFGGHDSLFFYIKANQFKIKVLEGWHGDHYRCKEVPKLEVNNGNYNIYSL